MEPAGQPASFRIVRSSSVVLVLPLVPVMPVTRSRRDGEP